MDRPVLENRPGITLAIVLLLCGALGVLHRHVQHDHRSDPVTGTVRDVTLVPFQVGTLRFAEWWQIHVDSLFTGPRLAKRDRALQTELEQMQEENRELRSERDENARLRQLIGFEARSPRRLLPAEVIALKPTADNDTLTIDRGAQRNVKLQAVVLAPDGALVGQVLDVSAFSANVLMITDAGSSVGGEVLDGKNDTAVGICRGDRQGRLNLMFLRSDAAVHTGDRVMTSGLGGVFPKNIPIGTVVSVDVDKIRSVKTCLIRPAADLDHLEEAFVVQ